MLGQLLVYLGFAAALIATVAYTFSIKNDKLLIIGRAAYLVSFFLVLFMSAYLLANIISHNYQIAYIYKYSSNELDFGLLLSTFYAGQEGSFLLWQLFYVITGVSLMFNSRKYNYEKPVMAIYSFIVVSLFLMLIFKSPFLTIWQAFPDSKIPLDFMPPNGNGMNPILENYWMIIHPPILFAGYVLVSIPYIMAIIGLIYKDKDILAGFGYKWILIGAGVLGLGLMLGGFWAYETLGWGGFWGWDPVENSSLLPWLASVALVHTILVQRKTGGLIKTNFFIAILTFALVLYATFLTRSGVLGDFSVHSFVDPGTIVYTVLLSTIIFFTGLGYFLLIFRFKTFSKISGEFKMISKENFMAIGSILLLISLAMIFWGTSYPIISTIFSDAPSSVEISFYNKTNLPIYIVVLLMTYITPFLKWKSGKVDGIIKKSIVPFVLAIASTVAVLVTNNGSFDSATVIIFAAFLSFYANLSILFSKTMTQEKLPAILSHIGLALLIAGAVISGYYEVKKVMLFNNSTENVMNDIKFKYIGYEQIEKEKKDREKYKYKLVLNDDENKVVEPIFYWSQFNNYESPFLEPGIYSTLLTDYYVSPNSVENQLYPTPVLLAIGESDYVPFNPAISIKLVDFDISKMMINSAMDNIPLQAIIEFNGKVDTLITIFNSEQKQFSPIWKDFDGINYKVGIGSIVFDEGMENPKAQIQFLREQLVVEISEKPLINLVWLGTILMVGGFIWAFARRKSKEIN